MSAGGVFWLEADPSSGTVGLWRWGDTGVRRLTPDCYSVRSRVNGYGGGALCAWGRQLYAVNDASGQVDEIDPSSGRARPVTDTQGYRYGGLVADSAGNRLLAVRERTVPEPGGDVQQLVAIAPAGTVTVLHSGLDFYGAPAVSADGRRLAWVGWSLPFMPWHRSTLWAADVGRGGQLVNVRPLPTPAASSVQQPRFAGFQLYALSDHQGWWQPYLVDWATPRPRWSPLSSQQADHANAPWQLGESHHQPLPDGGWVRVSYHCGAGQLWLRRDASATPCQLGEERGDFRCLQLYEGRVYAIAHRHDAQAEVVVIDPTTGELRVLAGGEQPIPRRRLSLPRTFAVDVSHDRESSGLPPVLGFYYSPVDQDSRGTDTLPPLIVQVHGGPTSAAYPVLNPQVQFWCQRGFAVADINHRGSSGFGRGFRLSLAGEWGRAEVVDIEQAVAFLVAKGLADPRRLFIQGRSAGGYSALMAMVSTRLFCGAVSLFGVSDPLPLRRQTHRFESGYLDWLLGDPQRQAGRWRARTPVQQAHRIAGEVLFFQGSEDRVVVPSQTRAMAEAMTAAGARPQVWEFEGEGHGFRLLSNQAAVLEHSLAFYRRLAAHCDVPAGDLG